MSRARLPLTLSTLGHVVVLAAIAWLAAKPLPVAPVAPPKTIAVVFAPPPTPMVTPPPPSTPPPILAPPPPPVAEVEPPPPPPKPVVERRPVRVVHRREPPRPATPPVTPPLRPAPSPQVAALPPAPPRPAPPAPPAPALISAAWRAELGAWLQHHKTYPEQARERGEEGEALLRFRVDRTGRVLDYAVVRSTGHPDLDAAVREMMQGATLPAFPPSMPQPQIQVAVAIRFALR